MDKLPPNFNMLKVMLCHNDHNYNYFAASKLKSISIALKIANKSEHITEMTDMLKELRNSEVSTRWD